MMPRRDRWMVQILFDLCGLMSDGLRGLCQFTDSSWNRPGAACARNGSNDCYKNGADSDLCCNS
jgi:hypothetical protein